MTLFFVALAAAGWRWGAEMAASDAGYRAATGVTLVAVVFSQVANLIGRRYEASPTRRWIVTSTCWSICNCCAACDRGMVMSASA